MSEYYIGTKLIKPIPMTRLAYNQLRGWELPADENGDDEGYLVEYCDGGKGNHPDFQGYISWSPKDVFDRSYRNMATGGTFGDALVMLKMGHRVARRGWNGANQFVFMVDGPDLYQIMKPGYAEKHDYPTVNPALAFRNTRNVIQIGWSASQTDMLADDWYVLPEEQA